jgi:hypothetical protein
MLLGPRQTGPADQWPTLRSLGLRRHPHRRPGRRHAPCCPTKLLAAILLVPLCPDHLRDLVELVALGLHLHHEPGPLDGLVGPAGPNAVAAVGEQRGLGQEAAEDPQPEGLALQAGDGDQLIVGGEAGHGSRCTGGRTDKGRGSAVKLFDRPRAWA